MLGYLMLGKFLDPKNDVAFKKIFGSEKNKEILIHFLNDMLVFKGGRKIQDVTLIKTILDPDIAGMKTSIVDVLCKDDLGSSYIVEMQVAKEKGFEKRIQYYAAKAYHQQLLTGGKYEGLKEIIFLAISDYTMFPEKKAYKSDHVILDKETYEHDLKDFSFTFVELSKFKKKISKLHTIVDKWCYFFKYAPRTSEDELHQLIGQDKILEKAYHELDRYGWNAEELHNYEQSEKYHGALQAALEQKYDEGIANAQRQIASKLLKIGLSLKEICEATKLSLEEVKALQIKKNNS